MSEDLIKRADAIEAYSDIYWIDDRLNLAFREELDKIDEKIRNIPTVEVADRPQGWIPCSERLPKGQGYYICTCKDGSKYKRATVVKWSNGWQLTGRRAYWVVVAWMPLPKPWKGADDE